MFFFDKGLFFSHLLVLFSRWFLFPFYQWDWFTTASWSSSCGESSLNWFETEAFGSHANCANCHRLRSADILFQPKRFRGFRCFPSFWGSNNLCEKNWRWKGIFRRGVFFFEVDEFSCYTSKFRIIPSNFVLHGMLGVLSRSQHMVTQKDTLQETNISPKNGNLKMIFLFPRWDMSVPWRVYDLFYTPCRFYPVTNHWS